MAFGIPSIPSAARSFVPQFPRRCVIDASLSQCDTFVLPPDDQYPRILLPQWPPYAAPPPEGSLVCVRGSRGAGVSKVVGTRGDDELIVQPVGGPRAGQSSAVPRRKAEIMRGFGNVPAICLCGETESFRRLARSQLLCTDSVLEIGCSYGRATTELASRAKRLLAVDVSADALQRAATETCAQHANIQFEELDATRELSRLLELVNAMGGVEAIFVDINGNRASAAVAPLLRDLVERLSPRVAIVKNRELYDAAVVHEQAFGVNGEVTDPVLLAQSAQFWQAVMPSDAMDPTDRTWRRPNIRWPQPTERLRKWAANRVQQSARADDSSAGCPADEPCHRAMLASWASAGPNSAATTLCSIPSTLDPSMRLEIRERANGWRAMHLVGGRRDIMNGVVQMDGECVVPTAVTNEYLKSMAALALAALERREPKENEPVCCLFLGLGAGMLPRLLAHHLPKGSSIAAVERDDAACNAAINYLGLDESLVTVERADALRWVDDRQGNAELFDAVFIDIFDERNLCPVAFHGDAFLTALKGIMRDDGVVVHNLHVGSQLMNTNLELAQAAYARVFGGAVKVASLDSKPWAGNALVAASRVANADVWAPDSLVDAADSARRRWNVAFDLVARCRGGERSE